MTTLQVIASWAEFTGFALAIWNGLKLLFTFSANAGTKIGKKVGNANAHTEGAIDYTNKLMKRQIARVVIFGIIGLIGLIIDHASK